MIYFELHYIKSLYNKSIIINLSIIIFIFQVKLNIFKLNT